jgi:hypothetical protein
MNRLLLWGVFALAILIGACASMPVIEHPQYTYLNSNYTILLVPEKPIYSPQLSIALSLFQMEYPEEQAEYLNNVLYPGITREEYKERIVEEQRTHYRNVALYLEPSADGSTDQYNWRYAETIDLFSSRNQGTVLVRNYEVYDGGEHLYKSKRYLVLDMDELRQIKIDDFFANFQENTKLRELVYEELRRYCKLEWGKPLSEGIYFIDEPELSFNFYVDEVGLGLHWDANQIAPYSYGEIEIVVHWQMLRPLMLYPAIDLLKKFDIHLFDPVEGP